jgi:hypothetical protein
VKQNAKTMIVPLLNNIHTTIRMQLTFTPIAALNEANDDDAEMRGQICDGHCGRTIPFVGFWLLMCLLCFMCKVCFSTKRLSQQPMGTRGSYTYGGIAHDEENLFAEQLDLSMRLNIKKYRCP